MAPACGGFAAWRVVATVQARPAQTIYRDGAFEFFIILAGFRTYGTGSQYVTMTLESNFSLKVCSDNDQRQTKGSFALEPISRACPCRRTFVQRPVVAPSVVAPSSGSLAALAYARSGNKRDAARSPTKNTTIRFFMSSF